MEEATHYLDVRIGIDFSEVLAPGNINGVKLILGATSDEEVIKKYSQFLVDQIEQPLRVRSEASILEVQINSVENEVSQPVDQFGIEEPTLELAESSINNDLQIEATEEEPVEKAVVSSIQQADEVFEKLNEVANHSNEESEDDESQKFFEFMSKLDRINEDLFTVDSFMGTVQKLKVKTSDYPVNDIGMNTRLDNELIEVGSDIENEYEIDYLDANDKQNTITGGK